jgi:hypothetical protein
MLASARRALLQAALTVAALGVSASPVLAQYDVGPFDETAEKMIVDLLIARPAGLAATVVGGAVFVLALPFTASTNSVDLAARKLVEDPANFTFSRPLGNFNNY